MCGESIAPAEIKINTEILLADVRINPSQMDSLPYPVMLINKNRKVLAVNKSAVAMGMKAGLYCWETYGNKAFISKADKDYYEKTNAVPPGGINCTFCIADVVLELKKPMKKKIPAEDTTFDTYWFPLSKEIYLRYAIGS